MRLLVINTVGESSSAELRKRHPGQVLQRPLIGSSALVGRRVLPQDLLSANIVDRLEYLSSIGNVRVVEMGAREGQVDFAEIRKRLGYHVRGVAAVTVMVDEVNSSSMQPAPEVAAEPTASLADTERLMDGRREEILALQHTEEVVSPAPAEPAHTVDPTAESVAETLAKVHAYVKTLAPRDRESLVRLEDGRTGLWINTDHGNMFVEVEPSNSADAVLEVLGDSATTAMPEVATPELWVAPEDLDALIRSSKNTTLSGALAVFGGTGSGKNKLRLISEVADFFKLPDVDAAKKFTALQILQKARES